ncbi:hypothetical protein KAM461_45050 [Aeromonas hydrophila]|nr:hypothetical protein KAM461_45050 [Aeromonas hydrophila]
MSICSIGLFTRENGPFAPFWRQRGHLECSDRAAEAVWRLKVCDGLAGGNTDPGEPIWFRPDRAVNWGFLIISSLSTEDAARPS